MYDFFNIKLMMAEGKIELSQISTDNYDLRIAQIIQYLTRNDRYGDGLIIRGKIDKQVLDQMKDRGISANLELYNEEYDKLSEASINNFLPYILIYHEYKEFYINWFVNGGPRIRDSIIWSEDEMKIFIGLIHNELMDEFNYDKIPNYDPVAYFKPAKKD